MNCELKFQVKFCHKMIIFQQVNNTSLEVYCIYLTICRAATDALCIFQGKFFKCDDPSKMTEEECQ